MKQNLENGTISELYTDDKKSKYSSNPNDILKSTKTSMKSFIQKRQTSKSATGELFNETSNKKKFSSKQFSPLPGKHFSRESYKIYNFSNKY